MSGKGGAEAVEAVEAVAVGANPAVTSIHLPVIPLPNPIGLPGEQGRGASINDVGISFGIVGTSSLYAS